MAWTSPKTWTDTSVLSASELNEQVRDNTTYLYDRDVGTKVILSGDVSKSSAGWSNITGLSFSVQSGKNYMIDAWGTYTNSNGAGGCGISYTTPGGLPRLLADLAGELDSTSVTKDWITTDDGGTGVASVDTVDTARLWQLRGKYECTASGTFQLRYNRNGAGTVTIQEGSGLFVFHD